MNESYREHRPQNFDEVRGQDKAVALFQSKLKSNTLPHVVMLYGPSGSGKTTLAKIIAKELGCNMSVMNLVEIDCAQKRSIDDVREITHGMHTFPAGGKARVWILDEVVQYPAITQQAFLKGLEEPPERAWFFLCTSEIGGLLPSFLSRCFRVNLSALDEKTVRQIVKDVATKNGGNLFGPKALDRIVNLASGNGRTALQLFDAAMAFDNEAEQLAALGVTGDKTEKTVEFLAKALIRKASWEEIGQIVLNTKDGEIESIRYQVLAYMVKTMVFAKSKATQSLCYLVIRCFQDSFREGGRAALAAACFKACQQNEG